MTPNTLRDRLRDTGPDGLPDSQFEAMETAQLERLEQRGEVVLWRGRWRQLASTRFVTAHVTQRRKDHLQATSRWRGEVRHWRVALREGEGAGLGDFVLLRPQRQGKGRSRGTQDVRRASVVKILLPAPQRFVARVARNAGRASWRSFDPQQIELTRSLSVPTALAQRRGEYFLLEIVEGAVEVVEEFGDPWKEPGADIRVLLAARSIPERFDEGVSEEARRVASDRDIGPSRKDFRGRSAVTIDGETAKDFDDAVWVEETPKGFRVDVHIADVAHYVRPQTALDDSAKRRGTSVYFPGRAVPMLPPELSEDACSLMPDQERLTLSVTLWFDRRGEVQRSRCHESVIRSRARLTYQQVTEFLERDETQELEESVQEMLRTADRLLGVMLERKEERRALDLDLPTLIVQLDERGHPEAIEPTQRLRAHLLIEELMVAANSAVAHRLRRAFDDHAASVGPLALYRNHAEPDAERFEELATAVESLLGEEAAARIRDSEGPAKLGELLDLASDVTEKETLSTLILRSLGRALYEPTPKGHFALGLEDYCHFTSPIRRYPDLIIHRLLKQVLRGEQPPSLPAAERAAIGADMSRLERRAEQAERELRQWQKIRVLSKRLGETADGRITGIGTRGAFVQLVESGADGFLSFDVEALVPLEVDVAAQTATTAAGKLVLGQRIAVRLERIDEDRRSIDFALVRGGAPIGDRRGSSSRRRSPGRSERVRRAQNRSKKRRRDRR
ncbi:MAG: VacB/RNase II family 3'-5' exoribonuclease [Acidobacteriota bacterium]